MLNTMTKLTNKQTKNKNKSDRSAMIPLTELKEDSEASGWCLSQIIYDYMLDVTFKTTRVTRHSTHTANCKKEKKMLSYLDQWQILPKVHHFPSENFELLLKSPEIQKGCTKKDEKTKKKFRKCSFGIKTWQATYRLSIHRWPNHAQDGCLGQSLCVCVCVYKPHSWSSQLSRWEPCT